MSNEIHPTHVLKQTSGPLTACAWSTNHRIAVAQLCGTDNRPTVEILDFNAQVELNSKPKLVAECVGHSGRIVHARFTRNGNHLATCGSDDGSAKIWETGTGAKIKSLKKQIGPNGAVNGCDWSPDGRSERFHEFSSQLTFFEFQKLSPVQMTKYAEFGMKQARQFVFCLGTLR